LNKDLSIQRGGESSQQITLFDPHANTVDMEEDINFLDIWRILKKYKWTIFAFFLLITITTAIFTLLMRPVYTATALIEVKPDRGSIVKWWIRISFLRHNQQF